MSENENKQDKLKEIQARLAEIQNKSSAPAQKSQPVKSDPAPEKSSAPTAAEEKTEEKKVSADKKKAAPSPPKASSQEENNWRANRSKPDPSESVKKEVKKAPVADKKKSNKPEKEGKKKKKKASFTKLYSIISIVLTLMVGAYFVYAFVLTDNESGEIESSIPTPIEDEDATGISEEAEMSDEALAPESNPGEEEMMEESVAEESPVVEEEEELPVKEPVVKRRKPEPVKESPSVVSKVPNGVIISYSSNSTESAAKRNAAMLTNKGFQASYYYMPDKKAGAPALYKVYIGPYSDESAAMSDFKKVVDLNKTAFILKVD